MIRNQKNDQKNASQNTPVPIAVHTALAACTALDGRSIVLVGLMGVGKSSIGYHLAKALALPFVDSDQKIEQAAHLTITEIFERFGEEYFRSGERRVIADILAGPQAVIATGGGAFIDQSTREVIRNKAVTVWLNASLDILLARTARRTTRPLLQQGDPAKILKNLATKRNAIYAEADIHILSDSSPHHATVSAIVRELAPCRA